VIQCNSVLGEEENQTFLATEVLRLWQQMPLYLRY